MEQENSSFAAFCEKELNQGATLVVRLDLNVPRHKDRILDSTRIHLAVETLRKLKNHRLVLLTHWGRPKDFEPESSLNFLIPILEKELKRPVALASQPQDVSSHQPVTLLENLRFFQGETKNDASLAKQLAQLGDVFINEAFSCSHRSHASIVGVPQYIPSYQGPAFEKEWKALATLRQRLSEGRSAALIGGSKVSTKIGVLGYLLETCDRVMIGGGMGNTFLAMLGKPMAESFFEKEGLDIAQNFWNEYSNKIALPVDGIERRTLTTTSTPQQAWGDIGPQTLEQWHGYIQEARTLFWNGPVGIYEEPPLDQGSRSLAQYLNQKGNDQNTYTVVGGGDTLAVAKGFHFSYASPSGGAFLEALEKGTLPGIEALKHRA